MSCTEPPNTSNEGIKARPTAHNMPIDFLKMYVETEYDDLPIELKDPNEEANSTLLDLFNCLDIDYQLPEESQEEERSLYAKYYMVWLMGIIRELYGEIDDVNINNCVLILTGREQIRKTSHFKFILPRVFRKRIAFTMHGFATSSDIRDIAKIGASNIVIVWDEIETFLTPETESGFKRIIDNNPQTIIDKYETKSKIIRPKAIYGGTSNQTSFRLSDAGSRRLFIIPINWCDTDRMKSLNWHSILREVIALYKRGVSKGKTPWLLSQKELEFQKKAHFKIRTLTDLDLMLTELFDFTVPIKYMTGMKKNSFYILGVNGRSSPRLLTTKEIKAKLELINSKEIKRTALMNTLKRVCSNYSESSGKKIQMDRPTGYITNGQLIQGPHKYWVLPDERVD
jgi:hypothetical protein